MSRPDTHFTGSELCALGATEAVALLRKGEVSPAEMLDASFARIAQVEPSVNATPIQCRNRAEAQLSALPQDPDHPGWLAGLPIAIKDLTNVSGVRTTFGSIAFSDFIATDSDPLVERLERRGGVIVGKTNTPEWGAGGNTFNPVLGATRNPWDTRRNAGGSSGGAAVSLATGEVWLSQGSDLAGSLRTPACYCGVVGFRPTPGRVGGGPAPAAFLFDGLPGPMARDVADTALFLDAMVGFDARQPISIERPSTSFCDEIARADENVRVAFSLDQNGFAPVEASIRNTLGAALSTIAAAGIAVEEACPPLPGLNDTYTTLRGVHYGSVTASLPPDVQVHFKETLRQNLDAGLSLTSAQIFDAMRQRTVLYQTMRVFLEGFDVLAIPVMGQEPGPVELEFPPFVDGQPIIDYVDWLRFSFLAVATGLPALSLPAGFTDKGLPVGLQLIGPPRGEAKLLRVAKAVETALALPNGPIDPMVGTSLL